MTAIVVPNQLPTPRPDHKRYTTRPTTILGAFLWRWRVWFEATFALTVMEPWEQSVARQHGSISFVSLTLIFDAMVLFSRRALRCARAFFHDPGLTWHWQWRYTSLCSFSSSCTSCSTSRNTWWWCNGGQFIIYGVRRGMRRFGGNAGRAGWKKGEFNLFEWGLLKLCLWTERINVHSTTCQTECSLSSMSY